MVLPPVTPENWHKVGDVHIRACICRRDECCDHMQCWLSVSEHDKQLACFVGYQYLSLMETKKETERTKINKEHCCLCFEHLGAKDRDGQKAFIANHNFR
jgi:hypothetical protein